MARAPPGSLLGQMYLHRARGQNTVKCVWCVLRKPPGSQVADGWAEGSGDGQTQDKTGAANADGRSKW